MFSLMQSNISSLSTVQSPPAAAANPAQLTMPYSASGGNSNNWHSANPLVMNHQLASPQASSNNNFSSLDDLDPFGSGGGGSQIAKPNNANSANMYTLQQPTVNYIYPTSYNSMNSMQPNLGLSKPMNLGTTGTTTSAPTLMPQMTQSADSKNLNTLSQQDILNFLN